MADANRGSNSLPSSTWIAGREGSCVQGRCQRQFVQWLEWTFPSSLKPSAIEQLPASLVLRNQNPVV